MAPTRYPAARGFALVVAVLFGLTLIESLSQLPFGDPIAPLVFRLFAPSMSQLSGIVFADLLGLLGAAATAGWPARGFLVFGAACFVMGGALLSAWPWNDALLRVAGGCLLAGGLYTWLGARQGA
ncbi:MAG TPA: hypothetical protein VE981_02780, partial [Planctomycetota bacterium]|nr:hypothetical protein [Planctomycetota bacterium]